MESHFTENWCFDATGANPRRFGADGFKSLGGSIQRQFYLADRGWDSPFIEITGIKPPERPDYPGSHNSTHHQAQILRDLRLRGMCASDQSKPLAM